MGGPRLSAIGSVGSLDKYRGIMCLARNNHLLPVHWEAVFGNCRSGNHVNALMSPFSPIVLHLHPLYPYRRRRPRQRSNVEPAWLDVHLH